jgi:hypothetical protein
MTAISTEILAVDLATHLMRAVSVAEELIARNALWEVFREGVDAVDELTERVLVIESKQRCAEGEVPHDESDPTANNQETNDVN